MRITIVQMSMQNDIFVAGNSYAQQDTMEAR